MVYPRFLVVSIIVTISQSAVLVAVGILFGGAYQSFASYLGYFDILVAAVFIVGGVFFYRSLVKRLGEGKASD